jgi:dihydroorotate dehydrogenase (NAD+) catalytic subunit
VTVSLRWDHPVNVGRVRLRNPVIASSGTYGYGLEFQIYGDPSLLGAVVVKSLTVDPRPGFPAPRVTLLDVPGSMVNAVGVPNPGVKQWAERILPSMRDQGVPVVASIWGVDADGVVAAAEVLARYRGPIAWEINLSCPNSEHVGSPVSHDPKRSAEVCRAVRELADDNVGIWAKLSPDAPDVLAVGMACYSAGADALTVSNTYPARRVRRMQSERPLGGGAGGISGPVLHQYVRPLVEKFASEYSDVPVIACGGVVSSAEAIEYFMAGASAVQVGTASLYDPRACHKIARGVVMRLREDAEIVRSHVSGAHIREAEFRQAPDKSLPRAISVDLPTDVPDEVGPAGERKPFSPLSHRAFSRIAHLVFVMSQISRRPDLWSSAVRLAARFVPDRWWRRGPFPSRSFLAYRGTAVYGMRLSEIPAEDIVRYLEWCRDFPGPIA